MLIRTLFLSALILTISACQSTPNTSFDNTSLVGQDAMNLLARAERSSRPKDQQELRINAARVFLFQGEPQNALRALAPLNVELIDAEYQDFVHRLKAQAWLELEQFNQAEQALTNLRGWVPEDFLLLAQVCQQQGSYRCTADNYIMAETELGFGHEQLPADIHDRIWIALSRAQSAPKVFTERYHHAWWLLQEQIRNAGSIGGQIQAWQAWQRRYPSHPASISPPSALTQLNSYQLPQVGFLLPLSGNFGQAGRAVRDGLVAAYLSEQGSQSPDIKFYDTARYELGSLYEQALREGADVIVGPLIKNQAEAFAGLTAFEETPRLLLNYLTETDADTPDPAQNAAPGSLFQFGIAIEDEAQSLANHVYLQGLERLLVVHSNDRWSSRALAAFQASWPNHITLASFSDITELTSAVGTAMQVEASTLRQREIADILGQQLEFLPRARGDLDGVIALTNHVEARALVPALNFHFANDLPVFATSQATRGKQMRELRGFESTDMPVFIDPNSEQDQLRAAFALEDNPLADLYALGFDAYRIALWLPLLDDQSKIALPAASGYLWLEPGGKFHRDLPISRIDGDGKRILEK